MRISIVVLTYNGYKYTHQLLMDIKQNCKNVYEVIVVDNGSEDINVKQGLEFWLGLNVLPLKVCELAKNRGFVGGMNYGLTKATGDVVVLLSNDVRIYSSSFLTVIEEEFAKDKLILLGATLYEHDTGWNSFDGKIYPYVEGYFLAATKGFWKLSGGFDERYAPSDFEDVDLSTQAVQHFCCTLKKIPGGMVEHLVGKTYGYTDERRNRTVANRAKFAKKWGISET